MDEDNLVLVILRDIQTRLGTLENRVDEVHANLSGEIGGLRTEMRAGFQAVMYLLATHTHPADGSSHGSS